MHDGLHYLVVGTADAVNAVVNQHTQVRPVFDTLMLEPLGTAVVHRMLAERYRHLRFEDSRPVVPPVDDQAVADLYTLYRGDLRGLLEALDDGVGQLIGLAGFVDAGKRETRRSKKSSAVRPLTLQEIRPALQQRYAAQLAAMSERPRVEQLTTWGRKALLSIQTQKSLAHLWKLSQATVSTALSFLVEQGYVVPLPRSGAGPTQYVLSGMSRLIFG